MSAKAECPACKSYLSAIYETMTGERHEPCPSCGLPASVLREVEAARKAKADADLTAKLEAALIRAGKAETALGQLRARVHHVRALFTQWEQQDPLSSPHWKRWEQAGWCETGWGDDD